MFPNSSPQTVELYSDPYFSVDEAGRITEVNHFWEMALGYDSNHTIGRKINDFFDFKPDFNQTKEAGAIRFFDVSYKNSQGKAFSGLIKLVNFPDKSAGILQKIQEAEKVQTAGDRSRALFVNASEWFIKDGTFELPAVFCEVFEIGVPGSSMLISAEQFTEKYVIESQRIAFKKYIDSLQNQLTDSDHSVESTAVFLSDYGKNIQVLSRFSYSREGKIRVISKNISETTLLREEIIANALRLEILVKTAVLFASAAPLHHKITETIARIGTRIDADRVYVFEDNRLGDLSINTHLWESEKIEDKHFKLADIHYESIPKWKDTLEKRKFIVAENISDHPSDIREIPEKRKVKSMVIFPIYIRKTQKGFLGVEDCREYRKWNKGDIEYFQSLTRFISAGKESELEDVDKKVGKQQFQTLSDATKDALLLADRDCNLLYFNNSAKKLLESISDIEVSEGVQLTEIFPPHFRVLFYAALNGNPEEQKMDLIINRKEVGFTLSFLSYEEESGKTGALALCLRKNDRQNSISEASDYDDIFAVNQDLSRTKAEKEQLLVQLAEAENSLADCRDEANLHLFKTRQNLENSREILAGFVASFSGLLQIGKEKPEETPFDFMEKELLKLKTTYENRS